MTVEPEIDIRPLNPRSLAEAWRAEHHYLIRGVSVSWPQLAADALADTCPGSIDRWLDAAKRVVGQVRANPWRYLARRTDEALLASDHRTLPRS